MIRLPTWLYLLLVPVVFLGSCGLSIRPVWDWQDRAAIRPVTETEKTLFPILARKTDDKYTIARLGDLPIDTSLVTSVAREEEEKINRDLSDSIGSTGNYRYFQILSDEDGAMNVSIELPTTHDSKMKGWYSLKQGSITPQKILSYGPSFAFLVMPWTIVAGLAGVAVYLLVVRRKKKPNQAVTANATHAA